MPDPAPIFHPPGTLLASYDRRRPEHVLILGPGRYARWYSPTQGRRTFELVCRPAVSRLPVQGWAECGWHPIWKAPAKP